MRNRMDYFFKWLVQPMEKEDIDAWKKANNIIIEKVELFEDFCFSLYYLVSNTYLGNNDPDSRDTQIPFTQEDKINHFEWCWKQTLENFNKENIVFDPKGDNYDYFLSFFFEVFYDQKDEEVKIAVVDFFEQLFSQDYSWSKSDLEMFTDLYKILDRSLQI